MFCGQCGNEIVDENQYCIYCGTKIVAPVKTTLGSPMQVKGQILDYNNSYKNIPESEVVIPENIEEIKWYGFYYCKNLKKVVFSKNISVIERNSFIGCENIEEFIVADDNPNYISIEGIVYNKALTELILFPPRYHNERYIMPDTVTQVQDGAFLEGCQLIEITVSKNLRSWSYLNSYQHLINVLVPENNNFLSSRSGILFSKDFTELLCFPPGKKEKYYITQPETKLIKAGAFQNNTHVECLEINADIEYFACTLCSNLTELIIGKNCLKIGVNAFYYCTNLSTVIIPSSVMEIGNNAFAHCPNAIYCVDRDSFADLKLKRNRKKIEYI